MIVIRELGEVSNMGAIMLSSSSLPDKSSHFANNAPLLLYM